MARPFFTYRKNAPGDARFAKGLGWYDPGNAAATRKIRQSRQAATTRSTARGAIGIQDIIGRMLGEMETPRQQEARARRLVSESISEQTQTLRESAQLAAEENRRKQAALAGFAGAFQQGGAGMADAIRASISGGGAQVAGLASGLSGALGGAQRANLDAATAAAMAATGGAGAVTAPSPEANAATANYLGGVIPRTTMERIANAEAQKATAQGDIATKSMWQDIASLAFAGRESEAELARGIRDVEKQRPKLMREALGDVLQGRQSTYATLLSALGLQNTIGKTAADVALDTATLNADIAADKARDKRERTKIRNASLAAQGFAPSGTLLPNWWVNPNTGQPEKLPSGTIIGPRGTPIKIAAPGKGKGAKQPTASDWTRVQDRMRQVGRDWLGLGKDGRLKQNWRREDLVGYLMQMAGQSFINTYGARQQVQQLATQIMQGLMGEWWERKRPRTGGAPGAATPGGGAPRVSDL